MDRVDIESECCFSTHAPPSLSLPISFFLSFPRFTCVDFSRIELNYSNKTIFWLIFSSVLIIYWLMVEMCSRFAHEKKRRLYALMKTKCEEKSEIRTANTSTVKPVKHDRTDQHSDPDDALIRAARFHASHVITFLRFYCLDTNLSDFF